MTTEQIVTKMIELDEQIEVKQAELSKLRGKLYQYKDMIRLQHPNEVPDIVEYLTKQKILQRRLQDDDKSK